jgi:hypothetical protein
MRRKKREEKEKKEKKGKEMRRQASEEMEATTAFIFPPSSISHQLQHHITSRGVLMGFH